MQIPATGPRAAEPQRQTSKGIGAGDIVLVDKKGRRFHALVTELEQLESGRFELIVRPLDSRISYRTATVREVLEVWRKRGAASPTATGSSAAELDLGLRQLGRGIGVAHDADAGVEPRLGAAQQRAAQRDAELAVLVRVGPADRPGVPAAVEPLERRDQRRRGRVRLAADRRRRVQQPGELERAARLRQLRTDRRREMLDVRHPHDARLVGRRRPRR